MTDWLAAARLALDSVDRPVTFFVRDDDMGWADDRLFALLDAFATFDLPVDLAMIPLALTRQLGRHLRARRQRIEVHQHGYAHLNHEPTGRNFEFGPSRDRATQRQDISKGRRRLQALLELPLQRIFTPPWNRCTYETAVCLRDLGFAALSRDASAGEHGLAGLCEIPITWDWFAQRKGTRLDPEHRGHLLAQQITSSRRVGIMLHHERMDADELHSLTQLLSLLAVHAQARMTTMAACLA